MNYRDLQAWQVAVDLSVSIFESVHHFPYREARSLADQMRSAAVSVPSNIAEAIGRFSYRDQRQFIYRSRGSLLELETQIELSRRLKFIDPVAAQQLEQATARLGQLLNGLIRYLSRRATAQASREAAIKRPRRGSDETS